MNNKIYFKNLDGLRFLCFLSVFLFHSFSTDNANLYNHPLYIFIKVTLLANAELGVNCFFVLSGFLITYLLIDEKTKNGQINLKQFWMRRILRIWPLYYFCVIFGFFIFQAIKTAMRQPSTETASLMYYLTFLANFDNIAKGPPDSSILSVLWSVAIEEQFYLIWPIILYILPIKKYWIVFTTVILAGIIFRCFYTTDAYYGYHTLSAIIDMAIGAFGAWLIATKVRFKSIIENQKQVYIILAYVVFFFIFFAKDEITKYKILPINVLERPVLAVAILLIILEQCFAKNSFYKMANFKTISKLGNITYGLYCLQFIALLTVNIIIKKLHFNTHLWQIFLVETPLALLLTIIIASISYKYYETPFLKLKEKFAYKGSK